MKIARIKYARVDILERRYPPPGYLGYLRYNFLMAWAIITIYTFKCVQLDPQQLPKAYFLNSRCNKCDMQKTVGGVDATPLGSLKVNAGFSCFSREKK